MEYQSVHTEEEIMGIFDKLKKKDANYGTDDFPSIMQANKVDGIGKSKDGNKLVLLIIDVLNWEEENEHLVFLQEKINAYIGFIECKQYIETYPDDIFDGYIIQISFMHEMSKKCKQFLEVASNQVQNLNIIIMVEIGG